MFVERQLYGLKPRTPLKGSGKDWFVQVNNAGAGQRKMATAPQASPDVERETRPRLRICKKTQYPRVFRFFSNKSDRRVSGAVHSRIWGGVRGVQRPGNLPLQRCSMAVNGVDIYGGEG